MYLRSEDFYSLSACRSNYLYRKNVHDKSERNLLLTVAISEFCKKMAKGEIRSASNALVLVSEILDYKDEWFEYAWQKEKTKEDDLFYFERFFTWFFSLSKQGIQVQFLSEPFILELPHSVEVGEEKFDSISCSPQIILRHSDGHFECMFLQYGKSDFSKKGRTTHTKLCNHLGLNVAKIVLEKNYPQYAGIEVGIASLRCGADKADEFAPEFTRGDSKAANLLTENFSRFGDKPNVEEMIDDLYRIMGTPIEKDCYNCSYKSICSTISLDEDYAELTRIPVKKEEVKQVYSIPRLNKKQLEAATHLDCPLRIVAGPGSGKTAVLVARIVEMVNAGIKSSSILVVAFTNKAVMELKERLMSVLGSDNMPFVTTFNALGYGIMLEQQEYLGGIDIKVLTYTEELQLVYNLTKNSERIKGISHGKIFDSNGMIETILRRVKKFLGGYKSHPYVFLEEYPNMDEGFFEFAYQYEAALRDGGYITYDEQISLCVELLKKHKNVLRTYRSSFKYIMVDEYQDANQSQAELVYMLAGENKNIAIVGDDDQAIYRFRGGDSQLMVDFNKVFPEAKDVILCDNYRSTVEILTAARKVISKIPLSHRIEKQLVAHKHGEEPLLMDKQDAQTINNLVSNLLSRFKPEDIAILSYTNSDLLELKSIIEAKTVISKSYLIDDVLFQVILNVCQMYYEGISDVPLFYLLTIYAREDAFKLIDGTYAKSGNIYSTLMAINNAYHPVTDYDYYNVVDFGDDIYLTVLCFISCCFKMIEECLTASRVFVKEVVESLGIEDSIPLQAIYGLIKEHKLDNIKSMYSYFKHMNLTGDDTLLDVADVSAINLMTLHDSKGREFEAVIMCNCQDLFQKGYSGNFNEASEELYDSCKLAYVGMTRAKEELYLLKEFGTESLIHKILTT